MLFLALRHLLSRKKQTILIFLGISLGTMMYTVISGLQVGMKSFIEERLLNNSAHIKISAREQKIDLVEQTMLFYPAARNFTPLDSDSFDDVNKADSQFWVRWISPPYGQREEAHILYPQGWFDRLKMDPEVLDFSPTLNINVILTRGKSKFTGRLSGIIPEKQQRVMSIQKYIREGRLTDLTGGANKIIIGDGLLEKLGAKIGDTIFLSAGFGEQKPLKVVGTVHYSVKQIDNSIIYAHLTDVQKLNKTPGQISGIDVSLADLSRAQEIADLWKKTSRDNVESWIEANANFLQIFDIQDLVRNIITIAILIVAGFGIYNVLSITISQKKKEIAILRSMGYTPRHISELFLIQGIILGLAGAMIGLVGGLGINLYLSTLEVGGRMGGESGKMLVSFAPEIYIMGFLLAFVSAVISSILPSLSAGRLTPIDIIRSEV